MRRAACLIALCTAVACDGPAVTDAGVDGGDDAGLEDAAAEDAGPGELVAEAGDAFYATVGEPARLDGSASVGATSYRWDFGDGNGWDAPRPEAVAEVTYDREGRFRAFLTVFDDAGRMRTDSVLVSVTHPIIHVPQASGSVAVWGARGEVAVVSPDSDELVVYDYAASPPSLVRHVPVGDDPRTVVVHGDRWVVTCPGSDELVLVDADGGTTHVALPPASLPFGTVGVGDALYVTLSARGEVARVEAGAVTARFAAIEDARGIAALPDGRILVSRWRSPDEEGQLAALSVDGASREVWTLAYDPQIASDTESGGVPSYLDSIAISPTGRLVALPSTQAAIGEGLYRSPRPLTFQTTLRAALSFLDPTTGEEDFEHRKLFDNRGLASAAVFSSRGDILYVAMRGSRAVERIDALTGSQAGSILEVGYAPQGLALSPDDALLFVDAYLSRELVVYDVADRAALPRELARLPIPETEPLDAQLLRGKILFNDSADPRLARDSYIACAHCHLEGRADHRTWDFTDRGEGLRNTIDLLGRAGIAEGPLHWSANFDEVQDFEHDIRGPFGGTGLMSDADFHTGTRDQTLGDGKAGVSEDLDALAAYVTSLDAHLPSPFRNDDGSLPAAAARGQAIFASAGCDTCHAGPELTDSGFESSGVPRLHDVGTMGPGSGQRLHGALTGIDTPTLHGLWQSAPYLHDGSAATLHDVLTTRNPDDRHGTTSGLAATDIDDLVAYLLCLDGRTE